MNVKFRAESINLSSFILHMTHVVNLKWRNKEMVTNGKYSMGQKFYQMHNHFACSLWAMIQFRIGRLWNKRIMTRDLMNPIQQHHSVHIHFCNNNYIQNNNSNRNMTNMGPQKTGHYYKYFLVTQIKICSRQFNHFIYSINISFVFCNSICIFQLKMHHQWSEFCVLNAIYMTYPVELQLQFNIFTTETGWQNSSVVACRLSILKSSFLYVIFCSNSNSNIWII